MVFAYTIAKYCFNESQNCFYSTHLKYISPAAYGITSYFLVLDWHPPPTIHALLNPYSYKNTKSGRQTDSQVSVNYLCLCFPKVWAKTFLYLSLIYLKSQILDHHGSSQMVRRRTNHYFLKLKKNKSRMYSNDFVHVSALISEDFSGWTTNTEVLPYDRSGIPAGAVVCQLPRYR